MSRTVVTLIASIAAVALVSGCGGSATDSTDTPTPPSMTGPSEITAVPTDSSTPNTDDVANDDVANDDVATEDDFVQAFATNYAIFDDDDAANDCVGRAFVDFVGLDQLTSTGATPSDLDGIILLQDAGLSVSSDDVPTAVDALTRCGDLSTVALSSSTATPEQTACAAKIVTNDLAAEQLLVQVSDLEPSVELSAARDALQGCSQL